MLAKARRDFDRLAAEPSAETTFNFFVTMYHVMDYVKALGTVDQAAIDAMYADADFDLCKFICNRGKHLVVKRDPKTVDIHQTRGAVLGRMMVGDPGSALGTAPRWRFFCDNNEIHPHQLGARLIAKWEQFFAANGLN